MKRIITITLLMSVTANVFAEFEYALPRALKNEMDANKGKIVIYYVGDEPQTLEGKERIKETALKITGPGRLMKSTDTLNVPGSGNKQIAVYSLKKDGSEFTFRYNSIKTKTKLASKEEMKQLKLGKVVTRPLQYVYNTAQLTQLLTKRPDINTSTLGFAYVRSPFNVNTKNNYLVIYDANGTWITSLDLEKGTEVQ